MAYVQVPDADPAGVVATAREHLALSGVKARPIPDLGGFARAVGELVREGWVVVLDEYQAFARRGLYSFNSALQFEVDRLRAPDSPPTQGGLILLGSVQTEMESLLGGYRAPLFGRVTDVLHLDHLAPSALAHILRRHATLDGPRLLFFWTLLQGIPKYWRDAYEVDALGAGRQTALDLLFFSGTAPLAAEGASWLIEELRGRYDILLRFLARRPGSTMAEITDHVRTAAGADVQVAPWLTALEDRFRLVRRLNPVFAPARARSGRYYLDDNFLSAWLGAIADPVALIGVRDTRSLVADAE